jgi:hypothetical protein
MNMWAVIARRSSSQMSRLGQLNGRKHGVERFIDVVTLPSVISNRPCSFV